MITVPVPLALGLGPTELLIIFAVIVLLFGASKLPDLARGSGRAIRIFKAETKGVLDDEEQSADGGQPGQLGKAEPDSSANPTEAPERSSESGS